VPNTSSEALAKFFLGSPLRIKFEGVDNDDVLLEIQKLALASLMKHGC
jgi:hypothetical protein